MPERPSFNPDQDKEAKAKAALEQAEALAAKAEAEEAAAKESGPQELALDEEEIDDLFADMGEDK